MPQETIGDRIKKLRKLKRLKLREVAAACGVTAQGVSNYEHSRSVPSTERISVLAQLFDVSERFLLTGHTADTDGKRMLSGRPGGRVVPKVAASDVILGIVSNVLASVQTHFPCGPQSYVIEIWDDSNAPVYHPADQIVLDPEIIALPGDMVLASVGKSPRLPVFGRYIRRVVNGRQVDVIEHLNPAWGEHQIDGENNGQIHAVMTEHAKPRRR
jgi:transcriptional regulator with XRE-family HTH domain